MGLSTIKLKQQAKKFNISGLGEILIRKMTIGDNVKVQSWLNENANADGEVTMDRFMMMKCVACMVTDDGSRIEIADAKGNTITDENTVIDALMDSLPIEASLELFRACNEVNPPPKKMSEKKSKS